jgi:hypothetical protein
MDTPETVTDAVRLLQADGFAIDFSVEEGGVHCAACGAHHNPAELAIRRRFRFEGPSDPGDMAVVLGVQCPVCSAKGMVVSAFGPDADDQLLALVERLQEG